MDDSISRQAALSALNGCTEIFLNNLPPTIFKTDAVEAVTALPPAQPDIFGINDIIDTIKNAISASTGNDAYMVGLRNGMRWCLLVLTDKEPEYEEMPSAQPVVISKSENTTECEDAVYRKELHRLFEDQWHYLQCLNWSENPKAEAIQSGVNWCINTLHDMPSVTPKQPGWIPCSRELPKKDGDYLVTTHSGQIARYIFIGGSSEEYWRRCATAWMPLPKPWEGEKP